MLGVNPLPFQYEPYVTTAGPYCDDADVEYGPDHSDEPTPRGLEEDVQVRSISHSSDRNAAPSTSRLPLCC